MIRAGLGPVRVAFAFLASDLWCLTRGGGRAEHLARRDNEEGFGEVALNVDE